MPRVHLRGMDADEFLRFREFSIAEYAGDLMTRQRVSVQEAQQQAQAEFDSELPQGRETQNQHVMMVLDAQSGQSVGWLWYLYEETDGVRQAFLNDLFIAEAERRKGYATAALTEMERNAIRDGCAECVLHVFHDNTDAIRLYQQCGYTPFWQTEDGMYMKKACAGSIRTHASIQGKEFTGHR